MVLSIILSVVSVRDRMEAGIRSFLSFRDLSTIELAIEIKAAHELRDSLVRSRLSHCKLNGCYVRD